GGRRRRLRRGSNNSAGRVPPRALMVSAENAPAPGHRQRTPRGSRPARTARGVRRHDHPARALHRPKPGRHVAYRGPVARRAGLSMARQLVATCRRKEPGLSPLVVLLTDGRANVPLHPDGDPFHDALTAVRQLDAAHVNGLVIDTESGPIRLGRARAIAEAWN